MAELKPCPFCGGNDIRKLTTLSYVNIWCDGCGVSITQSLGFSNYKRLAEEENNLGKKAIEAWNRRAEDGK